jgi:hypothetical protein
MRSAPALPAPDKMQIEIKRYRKNKFVNSSSELGEILRLTGGEICISTQYYRIRSEIILICSSRIGAIIWLSWAIRAAGRAAMA